MKIKTDITYFLQKEHEFCRVGLNYEHAKNKYKFNSNAGESIKKTGQAEGPQSWSGHRRHSSRAVGASKLGGSGGMLLVFRKIWKFSFSKMRNGAFSERNGQIIKQKLRCHMHVLSSKLNKFISYNGSLEWNFEPLIVNGNTVV